MHSFSTPYGFLMFLGGRERLHFKRIGNLSPSILVKALNIRAIQNDIQQAGPFLQGVHIYSIGYSNCQILSGNGNQGLY